LHLINIKHPSEGASFQEAVIQGLGRDQGLYFPREFMPLPDVEGLLQENFIPRSVAVLGHLIGDEIDEPALNKMVASAFDFPLEVPALDARVSALELFHGPSLAFKDFGARFMAACLAEFHDGGPMTILTATSGDTGAAVAHAYYGQPGINVVILYPKGRITPLQEKLFCTLGGNVQTIAVESDFDTCQHLVKACFEDDELRQGLGLNSANSINIARLLAQVCYYFEAGGAPLSCYGPLGSLSHSDNDYQCDGRFPAKQFSPGYGTGRAAWLAFGIHAFVNGPERCGNGGGDARPPSTRIPG
jgi:threonine synthase